MRWPPIIVGLICVILVEIFVAPNAPLGWAILLSFIAGFAGTAGTALLIEWWQSYDEPAPYTCWDCRRRGLCGGCSVSCRNRRST